ncbi:MAG: hypothetical protein KAW46_06260 [candidate division Zixibacteria bacterium]|nr:hypothetical protein [candidate division Zixibacteria bacterium]
MRDILLLAAMATLIPGLVLRLATRKHLTEFGRSRRWYNPAHWFTPPWKASTLFTPQGVRLFWASTILIEIGVVLYLINLWLY